MAKYNAIVPIDTNCYDVTIIKRLEEIYSNSKVHIAVMGQNTDQVMSVLPKKSKIIQTITEINAPVFNYSYAVNVAIKEGMAKNRDNDVVAVTDLWSSFSILQVEEFFHNENHIDKFLQIDVYKDLENSVNLESDKINLTILRRSKLLSERNYHKVVPIVICSLGQFNKVNGLEESLFTNLSRYNLIENLININMTKIIHPSTGLRLSHDEIFPQNLLDKDNATLDDIKQRDSGVIKLLANYGKQHGDPSRIKQLVINDVEGPMWLSNSIVRTIPTELVKDSSEFDLRALNPINIAPKESPVASKTEKILLLMNNSVDHVISATPLIRKLYIEHGPIDILTSKKMNTDIFLCTNYMIRKVFTFDDKNNGSIDFNSYDKIIKTFGCLCSGVNTTIDCSSHINTIAESNYKAIYDDDYIVPFCEFNNRVTVPPNCIVLVSSCRNKEHMNKEYEYWNIFDQILNKMKSSNMKLLVLNLAGELSNITYEKYKKHDNFYFYHTINKNDACSIIAASNCIITHPHTDLLWLSYALKKHTHIIKEDEEFIPIPVNNYIHQYDKLDEFVIDKLLYNISGTF